MNTNTKKMMFVLVLFVLFSASAYALTIDPGAVGAGVKEQLGGILKWYEVEDFETVEGKRVPILNEEYELGRRLVDFFIVFALIGLVGRGTKLKNYYGAKVIWIFSALIAFSFVASSKIPLVARLFPFVNALPFLLITFAAYKALSNAMGAKAGSFAKVFIMLIALLFSFFIFYGINNIDIIPDGLKDRLKLPGSTSAGANEPASIQPDFRQRLVDPSGQVIIPQAQQTPQEAIDAARLTAEADVLRADSLRLMQEYAAHEQNALNFQQQGNFQAAATEINLAEQKAALAEQKENESKAKYKEATDLMASI
ncbi:hypothetical protein ACFLZ7_01825 [Nanoarchaeota archaeon]